MKRRSFFATIAAALVLCGPQANVDGYRWGQITRVGSVLHSNGTILRDWHFDQCEHMVSAVGDKIWVCGYTVGELEQIAHNGRSPHQ